MTRERQGRLHLRGAITHSPTRMRPWPAADFPRSLRIENTIAYGLGCGLSRTAMVYTVEERTLELDAESHQTQTFSRWFHSRRASAS